MAENLPRLIVGIYTEHLEAAKEGRHENALANIGNFALREGLSGLLCLLAGAGDYDFFSALVSRNGNIIATGETLSIFYYGVFLVTVKRECCLHFCFSITYYVPSSTV